jgi:2-oxoglutarate decarboxylase
MSTPEADPLLDRLVTDFGGNYVFALDLLDQYREDPRRVDPTWKRYFDEALGVESTATPPVTVIVKESPGNEARPRGSGAPSDDRPTLARRDVPAAAAPSRTAAVARTSILPGDVLQPIRGGAIRLVENMEASLTVPTATSARTMPVRTVEENRRLLNKHRQGTGQGKISFTHIVAWAILRALDTFPRLNDAYAVVDGEAHRVQRDQVRLGIAVDIQRKDGSRTLLVPNIKGAQEMDFAQLVTAFDDLVARSRRGAISPDDFMGTTVSLTNPGTVGTTTSSPRLMPGQGLIVATGILDYPAEYRSMAPRTLGLLGISKVMTVTSTYDHRIIQGAESGLFLSRMEELLKGEDGFYQRIFEDLGLPHRPVRWETDSHPALLGGAGSREEVEKQAKVLQLIHAYRVRGHLVADLDPLDRHRAPHRDLDPATYGLTLWDLDREFLTGGYTGLHSEDRATLRDILDTLRETYCGTIGVEYMYIADPERKAWLQKRMESARNYPALDSGSKKRVLEKLVAAESFERFLHARYIGHKRFSLEGGEALIPLLDRILSDAAQRGMREVVMGMSHRGRLNVLANTVGKRLSQIFAEFEGTDPSSYQGSGDVKYHLGAAGSHRADTGETITVTVAPNPSHLEFVNPVVEGMVRAKQDAIGDRDHARILPLLLHGDAAFAGQGVVAETMHLSDLPGYHTGGTIHVVVNNQIGFTTPPEDARSSTYATDVAKMVHAPAFHVNGDDPEAVAYVAGLALEYRQKFRRDVVIDLVCYRRWGHNETDEPSYTQPLMYSRIKDHPSVATLYGDKLVRDGVVEAEERDRLWAKKKAAMQEGEPATEPFADVARREPVEPARVDAAAMRGRLRSVLEALGALPEGLEIHPKLLPFVRRRGELLEGRGDVDWATAESLSWGTLLLEGVPVRLSGQDSGRGTFSQRHAVLSDVRTGGEYVPLNAVAAGGARFEVYDSPLSEAAVMAFEYGYSVAEHDALVMWEAQFGDFMNGGQVIIDQFLSGSEQKWGQPSGLVLLLPHGHEGQGPEHSSARIERFLILCAEDNMRVVYPSTPASYFHLLRWQGRDWIEKPLVVFTPKSLLRNPRCVSSLAELAEGRFQPVLDDPDVDPGGVRRVALCSGKVYYDLLEGREAERRSDVALLRLEQLFPFPSDELGEALGRFPAEAELVWVQEEPRNMGAWRFVRESVLDGLVEIGGRPLRYVGRAPSAAPAPGSLRIHLAEQEALVREALDV